MIRLFFHLHRVRGSATLDTSCLCCFNESWFPSALLVGFNLQPVLESRRVLPCSLVLTNAKSVNHFFGAPLRNPFSFLKVSYKSGDGQTGLKAGRRYQVTFL